MPACAHSLTGLPPHLDYVLVCTALVRVVVLGVLEKYFVHVGTGVLEQFVGAAEHDERDLAVAEDAQFVCLLHESKLALGERHLSSGHS